MNADEMAMVSAVRLDFVAVLRDYFPEHVALQLASQCIDRVREHVQAGNPIRRIRLRPPGRPGQ